MARPHDKEYMDKVMLAVETAMQYGATWEQVETTLARQKTPCSRVTVWKECKKRYKCDFETLRAKRMSDVKLLLKQKAINMALNGNVSMLIFSLKNLVGWSDKVTHQGDLNNPIALNVDTKKDQMLQVMKNPEGREAATKIIEIARANIKKNAEK